MRPYVLVRHEFTIEKPQKASGEQLSHRQDRICRVPESNFFKWSVVFLLREQLQKEAMSMSVLEFFARRKTFHFGSPHYWNPCKIFNQRKTFQSGHWTSEKEDNRLGMSRKV